MTKITAWIPFLLVIMLIYSGMHLYVFARAQAAFHFNTRTGSVVAIFMILMVFSIIIGHVMERAGSFFLASLILHLGYIWLGLIFIFFFISLLVDFYRLIIYAGGLLPGLDISFAVPSPKMIFFIPLTISIILNIYGYYEGKNIRIEKVIVATPKLPFEYNRLRIVQISDMHLGITTSEKRLRQIVTAVEKNEPDILVSTGDLVDSVTPSTEHFLKPLKGIQAKYGKFAVTGNHEFYTDLDRALKFIKEAGFRILRGESVTVADIINIAGVDAPTAKHFGRATGKPEKELLSNLPPTKFTLLLKHMPLINKKSLGYFDLQLSGHTHKGQIFPFGFITRLVYVSDAGLCDLPNNSRLYVSRGTGVWGPPIRVLAPPEITIIDVVHKPGNRLKWQSSDKKK